jgi:hypothetical protein
MTRGSVMKMAHGPELSHNVTVSVPYIYLCIRFIARTIFNWKRLSQLMVLSRSVETFKLPSPLSHTNTVKQLLRSLC